MTIRPVAGEQTSLRGVLGGLFSTDWQLGRFATGIAGFIGLAFIDQSVKILKMPGNGANAAKKLSRKANDLDSKS